MPAVDLLARTLTLAAAESCATLRPTGDGVQPTHQRDELFRSLGVPLGRAVESLTRDFPPSQRDKAGLSLERFIEYADRVDRRYRELDEAQAATSDIVAPAGPRLDAAQRKLVDKTEAFHRRSRAPRAGGRG
jgi:hypothetical protein